MLQQIQFKSFGSAEHIIHQSQTSLESRKNGILIFGTLRKGQERPWYIGMVGTNNRGMR